MNVTCPSCETVYRVDPAKVPAGGVRARCAVCSNVFPVNQPAGAGAAAPVAAAQRAPAAPAAAARRADPPDPPAPRPPRPPPPPPPGPAAAARHAPLLGHHRGSLVRTAAP